MRWWTSKIPIDILQHLMIGSEGTLGFIAEITYRTVEDPKHKATALMLFPGHPNGLRSGRDHQAIAGGGCGTDGPRFFAIR
jgi:FAD/FMN-containing dehydrogenase